jgi:L-ascorbate metabolism protein UlaG (beta-lactamase superfamily)
MPRYTGRRLERVLASKQYRNGKFHNTYGVAPVMSGSTVGIMADFFLGTRKRTPQSPLPVVNPLDKWPTPPATGLRITWFGHSSFLLEIDGARILVDPMFASHASPVTFAGRKRFHPVPAQLAEFPRLDAVLMSHDHYDHLSPITMREIGLMRVPVITSLGVGARIEKMGVDPSLIVELDWWESHAIPDRDVSLTATPAQHFSGRGLTDRNATLWSSWVIRGPKHNVFYSADTGLNDELSVIGSRMGPFDLTLLEIGASNPAWAHIHLGPANAIRAFEQLGGGTLMPIHWGTFDLALHPWDEPPETLLGLAEREGLRVITPRLGDPVEPSLVEGPTPWWRAVTSKA